MRGATLNDLLQLFTARYRPDITNPTFTIVSSGFGGPTEGPGTKEGVSRI